MGLYNLYLNGGLIFRTSKYNKFMYFLNDLTTMWKRYYNTITIVSVRHRYQTNQHLGLAFLFIRLNGFGEGFDHLGKIILDEMTGYRLDTFDDKSCHEYR